MVKNESQIFTMKDTDEMNKGLNEIEMTTSQFLATQVGFGTNGQRLHQRVS